MEVPNGLTQGDDKVSIINLRYKPRGLINVIVHNHLGSNQERVKSRLKKT